MKTSTSDIFLSMDRDSLTENELSTLNRLLLLHSKNYFDKGALVGITDSKRMQVAVAVLMILREKNAAAAPRLECGRPNGVLIRTFQFKRGTISIKLATCNILFLLLIDGQLPWVAFWGAD